MKPVLQRIVRDEKAEDFYAFKLTSGGPYWRDEEDTKKGRARDNRTLSDLTRRELGFRLARDTEG
jgi:hypothetical protein